MKQIVLSLVVLGLTACCGSAPVPGDEADGSAYWEPSNTQGTNDDGASTADAETASDASIVDDAPDGNDADPTTIGR